MDAKKKVKEKSPKPKYNMWQNSVYMITLAWREKEKKVIVLCLLTIILSVTSNLVNLYISPSIINAVETKATLFELIKTILFFIGATLLLSALSSYISCNTPFGRITVRFAIVNAINRKNSTTSYPNLNDEAFRKLSANANAATNSNSQATEAIWGTLTSFTQNVIEFFIYLFILSSLKSWMLILVPATSIISFFVTRYVNGYGYRHRDEYAECTDKMWYIGNSAQDYTAAKDISIFNIRPWFEELGKKAMEAFNAYHKRAQSVYIWAKITDLILTFIRNGVVYSYLIYLVLTEGLSAAEFLLFFSTVESFSSRFTGLLKVSTTLYQQSLDISTVRECLEYPEPFLFEEGKPLEPVNGSSYEICLENVSYRYPGAEKDTLSNINLTLAPGEKLAVVGLNGAGKTTLVKLICGFLDPTEGRILLNGTDIREYNRRDYYRMFSAVFQTFSLLACTVAANVAQTEENIDMQRVKDCIDKAGLRSKIESLSNQYETFLNREVYEDATLLSGGETQRLMLARALYKDAPFIILDEPTAALDPIAEADMYQKYNEMTVGKSSVYISHRLASTRFCDRIVLIENGKLSEQGTHDELLNAGGSYADLFEIQSKYYREEECANE